VSPGRSSALAIQESHRTGRRRVGSVARPENSTGVSWRAPRVIGARRSQRLCGESPDPTSDRSRAAFCPLSPVSCPLTPASCLPLRAPCLLSPYLALSAEFCVNSASILPVFCVDFASTSRQILTPSYVSTSSRFSPAFRILRHDPPLFTSSFRSSMANRSALPNNRSRSRSQLCRRGMRQQLRTPLHEGTAAAGGWKRGD
jgi:hypothetical protein